MSNSGMISSNANVEHTLGYPAMQVVIEYIIKSIEPNVSEGDIIIFNKKSLLYFQGIITRYFYYRRDRPLKNLMSSPELWVKGKWFRLNLFPERYWEGIINRGLFTISEKGTIFHYVDGTYTIDKVCKKCIEYIEIPLKDGGVPFRRMDCHSLIVRADEGYKNFTVEISKDMKTIENIYLHISQLIR